MRFLGGKRRQGSLEQPPPEVVSALTDDDSDYGPVPPPPTLSQDEDDGIMPEKNDPPQDVTQEMSMDHYQEDTYPTRSQDEEDQCQVEYDEEETKYVDDDAADDPPTQAVEGMLDDEGNDDKSSFGFPWLIAAASCLVILAIVLGSGFGTGAFLSKSQASPAAPNDGKENEQEPTEDPDRMNKVSTLILTQSKDQEVLRNVDSAEYKAMSWLATADPAQIDPEKDTIRLFQRYVLASLFYKSTGVWFKHDGWLENVDECTWFGILCAPIDMNGTTVNTVTGIDLQSNGLDGGLPVDLSLLTHLKYLLLGNNNIAQDISAIQWDGMVLEDLSLNSNKLQGDIASFAPLGKTLRVLDLAINAFSGALPDLSALVSLEELNIESNHFKGEIPTTLGALPLKYLYVGDNDWTEAPIPNFLYTMTQLVVLSMRRSQRSQNIQGAIGTLNLAVLNVADNLLTGTLPELLLSMGTITELYVQNNKLVGSLPDLTSWSSLLIVNLSNNTFTGTLPSDIGKLINLQALLLSRNMITGSIPDSMTSLINLQVLDLARNRMTGELPFNIGGMYNLRELILTANLEPNVSAFSGSLPNSLGNLRALERLEIRSNSFAGTIPTNIQNFDSILHLDLRYNGLEGSIPEEVSLLADTLSDAYFQGNRLEGSMPSGICGIPVLETDCEMQCSCCSKCDRL